VPRRIRGEHRADRRLIATGIEAILAIVKVAYEPRMRMLAEHPATVPWSVLWR
jgi:hypothetical protein